MHHEPQPTITPAVCLSDHPHSPLKLSFQTAGTPWLAYLPCQVLAESELKSKHRTRLLCQVGSQIFIKLEGPLEFPSLLWVNKAHRSIFGSPCPFSFQLLRSSMNNIFWVFFFWLNCQHDLSCSIFFPLPSVNNGLSAELCANIHLDNLPKGVGRWWRYYFFKTPIMDLKGRKILLHGFGTKKEIKVIQCIDSLLFYKLAQTRFTTWE